MKKFLGLVFLAGFIFGGIEIWDWLRHREPVEVTLTSNEVSELPKHVRLKNVFLSPGDVVSRSGIGGKQLFIPIRAMDVDTPAKSLHFVLRTEDPVVVAAMEKAGTTTDLGETMMALKPLFVKREITGMIDGGLLTRKQRAELRTQFPVLTEDFEVLHEGRHPSLFTACFLFGIGAIALLIYSKAYPAPVVIEEPPVIAPAAASPAPPPVIAPPLLAQPQAAPPLPSTEPPSLSAGMNLRRAFEDTGDPDPITAGIDLIKTGNVEFLPGWLHLFAKARIYVVSMESPKPQTALVMGPGNYVAVFTQLQLAQECMKQTPQLKYAISLKGLELLQLVQLQKQGIWFNPLSEIFTVKVPAEKVVTLLEEARKA